MKKTICDLCGEVVKDIISPNFNIDIQLIEGSITCPTLIFIKVVSYQFNTSNFDVCKNCLWKAILRGVNSSQNQL